MGERTEAKNNINSCVQIKTNYYSRKRKWERRVGGGIGRDNSYDYIIYIHRARNVEAIGHCFPAAAQPVPKQYLPS